MKITVKQFVKRYFAHFKGIKIESSNDINFHIAEGRTAHWIASKSRVEKLNTILIISTHKPGECIIARITNVKKSKQQGRIIIFFDTPEIKSISLGNNELLFSRNPVGYF